MESRGEDIMEIINMWTGLSGEKDGELRKLEKEGKAQVYLALEYKEGLVIKALEGKSIQELWGLEEKAEAYLYMIAESPELAKQRFYDAQDQWTYFMNTNRFWPDIINVPEEYRPRR